MSENERLTPEETIEVGREVKSMRKVFLKIIAVSIIPLFVMGVAIFLITNISFQNIVEEVIKEELRTAAYGLSENYGLTDMGDYSISDEGIVYKGDEKVSGRLGRIGEELLKSGLVCTFFYENTRIDTTVEDRSGTNLAGTKLDENLYSQLRESGEELFCEQVILGGKSYYGYYIPYRNSDGKLATVFFAGRLREDVLKDMRSATIRIMWVGLIVFVIGIIVSLLCSIYMVGFIFKHFRNEQADNIRKIAAQDQMEFMTLVSRELRDPVDSIAVLSDKILEQESSPEIREKVLGIREAGNSMLISFNSIYDYSRLQAGDIEVNKDEYELTKLVSGCCEKVSPGIERKKLDFRVKYDESMPDFLKGDYAKIRQILDNLLENAVKYTYEGSVSLDIGYRTITPDKIDVTFTITDTGVGIRREDAEKLFLSIGKVGQSKNISIKGTGLGLLICKRLVNMMDGRISVDSEIGKGSTFRFTIPQDVLTRKTVGESIRNDN